MSSAAPEYLLFEKDGSVPVSTLLNSPDGKGPTIQALNMGFLPYPISPASHTEYTGEDLRFLDVSKEFLDTLEHWYNIFRITKGPTKEWGFDWGLKENVMVIDKGHGEFFIEHSHAKRMTTDLLSVYFCIRDIQNHPVFVQGTLLPTLINTENLLRQDFMSVLQIRNLVGISQIVFCTALAFINSWQITVGKGWDSTLMVKRVEFLEKLNLPELPLRGGVFDLDQSVDCHLLDRCLKNQGPVFIIVPSIDHPQRRCFLRINHDLITCYHVHNHVNHGSFGQNLLFKEIHEFKPLIPGFRATNRHLHNYSSGEGSADIPNSPSSLEFSPPSSISRDSEHSSSNDDGHPRINNQVPGYPKQDHPIQYGDPLNDTVLTKETLRAIRNWLTFAAPNQRSLEKVEKAGPPLNALLLQNGYLAVTVMMAALLKGWTYASPKGIHAIAKLLHHCIHHNKSKESYPLIEWRVADVPSLAGFREPQLDDTWGSAILNACYRWKASHIASRANIGAAIAQGNSIGWIAKKFTGEDCACRLLDGPSFIAAHLFWTEPLFTEEPGSNPLVCEYLTLEEELALLGFILGNSLAGPRYLFPPLIFLQQYLKGFFEFWTNEAEVVMRHRWDLLYKGEALAMTEREWALYLAKAASDDATGEHYEFTSTNAKYGRDLLTIAYPVDWTLICLSDLTFN
ncbi:hypothetical protein ARMSODRAFT_1021425 [Armillaria solidipes]|uniref:Uncharacterized protein n=1 Tax=Armillaria solidipes TaxID=1076256 RepID=A0A2H3BRY5_9AGAR|nr:hypothetical protein ARMSODRAFT_1021425 [Armillaria solidipes]